MKLFIPAPAWDRLPVSLTQLSFQISKMLQNLENIKDSSGSNLVCFGDSRSIRQFRTITVVLIAQKVGKLVLSHGFEKEKSVMEGFLHGPGFSSYENGD